MVVLKDRDIKNEEQSTRNTLDDCKGQIVSQCLQPNYLSFTIIKGISHSCRKSREVKNFALKGTWREKAEV